MGEDGNCDLIAVAVGAHAFDVVVVLDLYDVAAMLASKCDAKILQCVEVSDLKRSAAGQCLDRTAYVSRG